MYQNVIEPTYNSTKVSGKQRKLAMADFRQQCMQTSKIENRKPIFISETIRDSLNRICINWEKRLWNCLLFKNM
jgi:hypothetical protein